MKTKIRRRRRLVARGALSSSRCAMYHRTLNGMLAASPSVTDLLIASKGRAKVSKESTSASVVHRSTKPALHLTALICFQSE